MGQSSVKYCLELEKMLQSMESVSWSTEISGAWCCALKEPRVGQGRQVLDQRFRLRTECRGAHHGENPNSMGELPLQEERQLVEESGGSLEGAAWESPSQRRRARQDGPCGESGPLGWRDPWGEGQEVKLEMWWKDLGFNPRGNREGQWLARVTQTGGDC